MTTAVSTALPHPCLICHDALNDPSSLSNSCRQCKEIFHKTCLGHWHNQNERNRQPHSCPKCRFTGVEQIKEWWLLGRSLVIVAVAIKTLGIKNTLIGGLLVAIALKSKRFLEQRRLSLELAELQARLVDLTARVETATAEQNMLINKSFDLKLDITLSRVSCFLVDEAVTSLGWTNEYVASIESHIETISMAIEEQRQLGNVESLVELRSQLDEARKERHKILEEMPSIIEQIKEDIRLGNTTERLSRLKTKLGEFFEFYIKYVLK